MDILIPALCIVGGIGLLWLGGVLLAVSFAGFDGIAAKVAGVFLSLCIMLVGLFVKFYLGWWGVICAIIDYAKQ